MNKYFTLIVLFGISFLEVIAQPATTGCHFAHQQNQDFQPLTSNQKRAIRASVERSDSFDVLHYDIELEVMEFNRRMLEGVCTIDFQTRLSGLNHFSLDLLDLEIHTVENQNGPLSFHRSGFNLIIDWPAELNVGTDYSVTITYGGRPTVSGGGFGGFYFENDYAYNLGIDLIGAPHNFGRSWFPCFDNFVERATYKISLITNAGRKGYAIGNFLGEEVISGDTIKRTYAMDKQLPTYLVGVAVSEYVEDNYVHNGVYGDIPVQIVAKQADLTDAQNSLAFLPDAIDCLEFWYGPYVWNRVGYIMTVRGAMEHAGNIAYPENSVGGGELSTRLMTHELCHHWWGNLITVNYAPDMWIKEGNAEYGAHLIEEFMGGAEPFRTAVRNNHLFVITTAHVEDGDYLALSPLSQENTYGRHTYYRGASMMHNLRAFLGDSLFRAGQQKVLETNAYSFLNAQAYRDALADATGLDLGSFFDNWIFTPGYSDYFVHHFAYDENTKQLDVHIGQNKYHSTTYHQAENLPIRLYFEDGSSQDHQVIVGGEVGNHFLIDIPSQPISITVNPNHQMNLGMFEDAQSISETGSYREALADYNFSVNVVNASFELAVEHHLTAPAGEVLDEDYRLSINHFWHIAGTPEQNYEGIFQLFYDRDDNLTPDDDLVSTSEDSIVLLYRPDALSLWTEYDDYNLFNLLPNDGKGTMNLFTLRTGDYAFGNRVDKMVATQSVEQLISIEIYPNPSTDHIYIDFENQMVESIKVYNIEGVLVQQLNEVGPTNQISIAKWVSGVYFIAVKQKNGNYLNGGTFVVH